MTRDYHTEFVEYIDERIPDGDYVLPVFAQEIVEKLRANDTDLLSGWLDLHATQLVTEFLGNRERSKRSRNGHDKPKKAFSDAAERLQQGEDEMLTVFRQHLVINGEQLRRPVGKMTKADHTFVADRHIDRANAAKFEAAFHRAVAKRIPQGKTTADVMTEAEYLKLRQSGRPVERKEAA